MSRALTPWQEMRRERCTRSAQRARETAAALRADLEARVRFLAENDDEDGNVSLAPLKAQAVDVVAWELLAQLFEQHGQPKPPPVTTVRRARKGR
jgi:hypothetical protein